MKTKNSYGKLVGGRSIHHHLNHFFGRFSVGSSIPKGIVEDAVLFSIGKLESPTPKNCMFGVLFVLCSTVQAAIL